jgi:hypothetical protein
MEGGAGRRRLRVRVGLAFVRTLRPALYALLVCSALLSFWAGGEIAGRRLPGWAASLAPALFGVFLAIFAVYRLALVRARRYPAATGLFQIGLGVLVFVLLRPATRRQLSERAPPAGGDDVTALLASPDPRLRAVAAELAGYRYGGARWLPRSPARAPAAAAGQRS